MTRVRRVDPKTQVVGVDRRLQAGIHADEHDAAEPVDGVTFGVGIMTENAPHGGERHLAGDEVLYLVEGKARLVFPDDPEPDVELECGEVVIVPRGLWHRVEILEPCRFVYLTPGHGNEIKPIPPD